MSRRRPADALERQLKGCGPSRKRPRRLLQRYTLAVDAANDRYVWLEDRRVLDAFGELRDRRLELAAGCRLCAGNEPE
jgi:hypothetical protein